jgi:tRNA threonylcarbamoyl adenosine modification protein YeaZ
MGAIDEALRRAGIDVAGVDGVAVGIGPGSFTGVRIGVATARALAFAAAKPIWGVSTLAAMARRGGDGLVVAAIPSRQGEVFVATYEGGTAVMAPCIITFTALESWILAQPRPVKRVGVGADAAGPRARDIAALAFAMASQAPGGQGDALTPTYLAAPPIDASRRARYRP